MELGKKIAIPRLRRAFVRARDVFPITWLGIGVAATGTFVLRRYAFGELDLVLLVLGYGALAVLALSALLVLIGSIVVRVRLRAPRVELRRTVETGRFVESGFAFPTLRFFPLLATTGRLVEPPAITVKHAASRGTWLESLRADARGEHTSLVRSVTIGDVFGLVRVTLRHRTEDGLRAVPHVGAIRDLPTLRSLASGEAYSHPLGIDEGDRMDLRRYAPGDPARFVHWKALARTGRLVVRVPERAIAPARRIVAYFVAGEGDEASAGAARAAVERQAFGADFLFGADGTSGGVRTAPEVVELLVRSARAKGDGAAGLPDYLAEADREGPATVVLFVPPRAGTWLPRVLAVARARRSPLRVVIGVDGLVASDDRSLLERALTTASVREGESLGTLLEVRSALVAERAEVLVVDRVSGRLLAVPSSTAASIAAFAGAKPSERAA